MNREDVIKYLSGKNLNQLTIGDEDIIFIRNLIHYVHNKLIPAEEIIHSFQIHHPEEIAGYINNMIGYCLDKFEINTITGKDFIKFY